MYQAFSKKGIQGGTLFKEIRYIRIILFLMQSEVEKSKISTS